MASNLDVFRPDGSPRPVEEAPPLRAINGEHIKNMEEIVRDPTNNELRYREVNASPVKDDDDRIIGAVSVVRDITDSEKAEEVLQRNEPKYRFFRTDDAIRQIDDSIQIQETVIRLLGRHLQANRVFYSEIVVRGDIEI